MCDPYEDYIKNNISSTWRASILNNVISCGALKLWLDTVGSCSMLPREKRGVVDPKLKVSRLKLTLKSRKLRHSIRSMVLQTCESPISLFFLCIFLHTPKVSVSCWQIQSFADRFPQRPHMLLEKKVRLYPFFPLIWLTDFLSCRLDQGRQELRFWNKGREEPLQTLNNVSRPR